MKERLERRLTEALSPSYVEVNDDSAAHVGHAGALPGGETHFTVVVVSKSFENKSKLERHRMVYKIINDEFSSSLHALVINPLTPAEHDLT